MKKNTWLIVLGIALCLQLNTACTRTKTIVIMPKSNSSKGLPPGQAKKVTGSQSAKPHAPGQQKKKH